MENKNVPQWILDSTTGIEEQNDEVGLVVAGYIGAFMKRGFTQGDIGIALSKAFLLSVEEVEARLDAILNCSSQVDSATARRMCLFTIQQGYLFDNDNSDPCGIVELLKVLYGGEFTFEALLQYPQLLMLYKKKDVRNSPQYAAQKKEADAILDELERVYKS